MSNLTPPPIKDFSRLHIPPKESVRLSNGVYLNFISSGQAQANRTTLMWNYGTNRGGNISACKIVPEVLKQGTKKLSGAQLVEKIDFLGAFVNHNVGANYTSIDTLSLNEFTPALLDVVSDMVLNPAFSEEKFEALKRKMLARFDLAHQRTAIMANEKLMTLLAGCNHPYYCVQSRKDIENMTLSDVIKAWADGVNSTEIHFFTTGNINNDLIEKVKETAYSIRPRSIELLGSSIVPFQAEQPGRYFVEMSDASQSSVAIGIPTIGRIHPDFIPLRIAVVALGGYFGSRLMTSIREEKGLTYGISAFLAATFEGAHIEISADCDVTYVEDVLAGIDEEIRRLAEEPMHTDEFRRLRSYYMTTIVSILETFKSIGEYYESQLTVGITPDYFERQQEVLESLTPQKISEMVSRYLIDQPRYIVVAGQQ